jgi:hypothetical protein
MLVDPSRRVLLRAVASTEQRLDFERNARIALYWSPTTGPSSVEGSGNRPTAFAYKGQVCNVKRSKDPHPISGTLQSRQGNHHPDEHHSCQQTRPRAPPVDSSERAGRSRSPPDGPGQHAEQLQAGALRLCGAAWADHARSPCRGAPSVRVRPARQPNQVRERWVAARVAEQGPPHLDGSQPGASRAPFGPSFSPICRSERCRRGGDRRQSATARFPYARTRVIMESWSIRRGCLIPRFDAAAAREGSSPGSKTVRTGRSVSGSPMTYEVRCRPTFTARHRCRRCWPK